MNCGKSKSKGDRGQMLFIGGKNDRNYISNKNKRDILSANILKMADMEADVRIAKEVLKLTER